MSFITVTLDIKTAVRLLDHVQKDTPNSLANFRDILHDNIDKWIDAAYMSDYWRDKYENLKQKEAFNGYKKPYENLVDAITKMADKLDNVLEDTSGLTAKERFLAQTNQKIMAIKSLRERANLGLKEAKDTVDAFCSEQ